jgi:inosine-uridine nucleoside N-ribohydrolase
VSKFSPAPLSVHAGAASAGNLHFQTAAVKAMHAAIAASNETVTVVAVGPLTNVASLLHQNPDVADRITEVIAVAGRRPLQRFTTGSASHPDLNFEKDPEAFAAVLGTAVPLTLAPFELSSQVNITLSDLDQLQQHGGAIGAYVHTVGAPWLALWQEVFGVDYFHPFDSLAALIVTHPALVQCTQLQAWIEIAADDLAHVRMQGDTASDAATGMKPYLHVAVQAPPEYSAAARAVRYCHTPLDGAKAALIAALTSPTATNSTADVDSISSSSSSSSTSVPIVTIARAAEL